MNYFDCFYSDYLVDERWDLVLGWDGSLGSPSEITAYVPPVSSDIPVRGQFGYENALASTGGLHAYLKNLGSSLGFYEMPSSSEPVPDYIYGLTAAEQVRLFKSFSSARGFDVTVHSCSTSPVGHDDASSELIREGIDFGYPVLIGTRGHSMIVYAYDDLNIYIVTGWGSVGAISWDDLLAKYRQDTGERNNLSVSYFEEPTDYLLRSHIHSDNFIYNVDTDGGSYRCLCGIYLRSVLVDTSELGYSDGYCAVPTEVTHTIEGVQLDSKRLRAGNIQGSYLTLSARKIGAGQAYWSVDLFSKRLLKAKWSIALWGDREYLDPSDSAISLEYWDVKYNGWATSVQLLGNHLLPLGVENAEWFGFDDITDIEMAQLIVTSGQVGTWNKGRVVCPEAEFFYI